MTKKGRRLIASIENWKEVAGFDGKYLVSNFGRIYSKKRKGLFIKPCIDRYGYEKIVLWKNCKPHYATVHRVVALAFIEQVPGKNIVNHKNGIKTDNDVTNLEWCTSHENTIHSFEMNLQPKEMKTVYAKCLATGEVSTHDSQVGCAKALGLIQGSISNCLLKRQKKHNGYVFSHDKEDFL
ncbi:MAG: NUMOD4 domain-containing protein [Bacilli bacterium]